LGIRIGALGLICDEISTADWWEKYIYRLATAIACFRYADLQYVQ